MIRDQTISMELVHKMTIQDLGEKHLFEIEGVNTNDASFILICNFHS